MAVKLNSNWYYIHIPKCGGWSMATAFGEKFVSHDLAMQMRDKYPEYNLATTVRNTYDRLFSCWKYDKKIQQLGISFEFFILYWVGKNDKNWFGSDGVLRYCLGRMPEENNLISYYMNFAKLQDNFDCLCEHINIAPRELPKTNATYEKDYRNMYDKQMIFTVDRVLRDEIEYFQWEFDNPYKCAPFFNKPLDLANDNFSKAEAIKHR